MIRDITQKQFDKACTRRGFKRSGFLGYYELADTGTSVSVHNAGKRRRNQLAYLIQHHARVTEQERTNHE